MKLEETEDLGQGVSLKMVLIPEGKFVMGSPYGRFSHESERQHEVTLTKPFYLGIYTVTQEQWEAVMGNNPSEVKEARLPVTDVSWENCQEFIKKLNEKTNGGYRFPTEAEWEYACRAGTTTAYSVGNRLTKSDANIHGDSIKAVGSYKPNAFGLYDMHGNVWEWCEDWYGDYPAGAVTDPKGPATGERRVFRGGSFVFYVLSPPAHSSDRNFSTPTDGSDNLGFRLARTVDLNEDLDEDLYLDEDEDEVLVYDPLNLSEEEEKERASFIAEVEKQCRVRAKELGLPGVEEQELAEGLNLEMVLIPAGKFVMGSPKSEEGRSGTCDETQHEVTLTKPFYMGKYEVTQEQWEAVMGNNPSETDKGPKLPVTHVSWEDCQEFIKKLNEKKNGGYRLPTEAEWEYGCRAGTTTAYSYGDSLTKSDVNIEGDSIKAVGSYKPNSFGLYDIHGNVWEWCEDWYGDYPAGAVTDPKGPAKGEYRVLRGGSFFGDVSIARSSDRSGTSPSFRSITNGFRLARTP